MTHRPISETAFQAQVIELAELYGWRVLHVRRSKARGDQWATTTSITGWPDLFLFNPSQHRAIAAELKSDRGRATPAQIQVLTDLNDAGIPTYLWRPTDLDDIASILGPHHGPDERR